MVSSPFTPANLRAAIRLALAAARACDARVALTGGAALEAWGVSRATQDVDFVFLLPVQRRNDLREALVARGATILEFRGDAPATWLRVLIKNFQFDWLLAWDRPTQRALRRAVVRRVLGMRLPVLQPEDLILLKLRVGRPRDLDDAARLYAYNTARLNRRYFTTAVRQLHLSREWTYLMRVLSSEQTRTT